MLGPWFASEMTMDKKLWAELNDGGPLLNIVQANWDGWQGDIVACVWSDDGHDEAPTARLIAAAPDLYEALDDLVSFIRAHVPIMAGSPLLEDADAALARARGEVLT
jgi:hypothetical protein